MLPPIVTLSRVEAVTPSRVEAVTLSRVEAVTLSRVEGRRIPLLWCRQLRLVGATIAPSYEVSVDKVNIRDLKANLSALIERVEAGETIIVTKRNEPVAELRPISRRRAFPVLGNPVIGVHVPSEFFDPLPEELLAAFDGD